MPVEKIQKANYFKINLTLLNLINKDLETLVTNNIVLGYNREVADRDTPAIN